MKSHRPWQPYMGSGSLFNPYNPYSPYNPAGRATTLDHFDLIEDQVNETEAPAEDSPDTAGEPPPLVKRD